MPDFAQHSSAVISFLIALGCLLWIYNQARQAMGKNKIPRPLAIEMAKQFVERHDYDKDKELVDVRLTAATRSRKEIHADISSLKARTGRIEEHDRAQTDTLNLLSADFREFSKEQRQVNKELLRNLPKS